MSEFLVLAILLGVVTVELQDEPVAAEPPPGSGENLRGWTQFRVETLTDFDDLQVTIDGERHTAFLIGLRPFRDSGVSKARQTQVRELALGYFQKADLRCRILERRGDRIGVMVDAFSHLKHPFPEEWDPAQYPWCRTGWGAYNFNLYFLHLKLTQFQENFDVKQNPTTKSLFDALAREKSTIE